MFEKAVTKVRYFSADEHTRYIIESYEKARRDELMRINDAYEDGEAEGKMELLFDLVARGLLTDMDASASIKMPVADFKQRMSEFLAHCDAAPNIG